MAQNSAIQASGPASLTTTRGAALYIGRSSDRACCSCPGSRPPRPDPLRSWPGSACLPCPACSRPCSPASAAKCRPAGGVMGYVTVAWAPARAGDRLMFLAGYGRRTIVCLIGASYVTDLTSGGHGPPAVAAGLLLIVIGTAACGLRAGTAIQLVLVILLVVVVVVAVTGSASARRATGPRSPRTATCRSAAPRPRSCSPSSAGRRSPRSPPVSRTRPGNSPAPSRSRSRSRPPCTWPWPPRRSACSARKFHRRAAGRPVAHVIGTAGPTVAAVAAIVLTIGTTNAYINGAIVMTTELVRPAQATPA